jgi:hypothetical protein
MRGRAEAFWEILFAIRSARHEDGFGRPPEEYEAACDQDGGSVLPPKFGNTIADCRKQFDDGRD